MDGLVSGAIPLIEMIVVYISYIISSVKKFFNLFTFSTGVQIIPED